MAEVRKHIVFHGRVQGVGIPLYSEISGEFTKSGWLGSERMGWNRYNGSSGTGMADQ